MSDLIDRQDAISLPVMPKKYRKYQTYNLDDAYEQGWEDLQKCIERLPSAQPEIIRCKDCKYYRKGHDDVYYCQFHDDDILWQDDDYCSYGKMEVEHDCN